MPGSREQNAWVERVLGAQLPAVPDAAALGAAAAAPIRLSAGGAAPGAIRYVSVDGKAIWRAAREAVDAQFGALQSRLRDGADPGLQQIASHGLPILTKRLGTQMLVALTEVDSAPPERAPAAREQALKAIAAYRSFLDTDGLVRALEANPFSVPITIRGTLGGALDRIAQALRA